jgi:histidine ammonia-lyase
MYTKVAEARIAFDGQSLSIKDVWELAAPNAKAQVEEETRRKIVKSRERFEAIVAQDIPIYGVTTGYGEMVYVSVPRKHETKLQTNLVLSHSAGVGEVFGEKDARAILAARINALCKGYSAVRIDVIERLVDYLNLNITPVIPKIGSLGASGDLGPLAHIAATLIGYGEVYQNGRRVPTSQALENHGLKPLQLKFKEGLSLINGTSAMTGVGSLVIYEGLRQVVQAEVITALVLETQKASASPFQPEGHDIARPHPGQIDTAYNLRVLTAGSDLVISHRELREQMAAARCSDKSISKTDVYIQKAYTLRCIPQMVGAIRDSLYHAKRIVETELNSANDNPLLFEDEEIFHGGNFHGQPIAIVMDLTSIALTQLGVISERRTNRLLNRHLSNGLPEFLVKGDPGLNCGLAGAQYPATALVAENRVICTPASIQSIPSNGDNQDVVSMGLISARNASRILRNNNYILAVEYLAAAQAVDIMNCYTRLSPAGKAVYQLIRDYVPVLENDRFMSTELEKVAELLTLGILADQIADLGITLR